MTDPARHGVILAGPPGVGKTRLGHECLRIAEDEGLATEQVLATKSAAQVPFGAVAPLLHAVSPEPGVIDDRVDLLRQSVAALAEQSQNRRLLLFVDDAHLLDDASATLVHQVAATGVATVLATVQTGETAPDPVRALWKDGLAQRIEISGLDPDSIEELLSTVLGGPADPATAIQFAERCQGNVLFLRELVIGARDDGSLHDDGGIWRLQRPLSPSARLVEIVEARLGRLDEEERALMELVAYGEPLGHVELTSHFDPALAETLERRELLASHMDGRRLQVHLAHPIYGDVIRARTPALRSRQITRSLADAVEAAGPARHEDVLRVATWRYMAGEGAPDVLLEGARIARWRYDLSLAEDLARAALDAGAGFDAALLSATLAGLQGRREDAEIELARLAAEATGDEQRARVAIARFDNTIAWSARDDLGILDEAEKAITDPSWQDLFDARRLGVILDTAGPDACAKAAQRLAGGATGETQALACLVGAYSLARLGQLDRAMEMSECGRTARQTTDTPLAWYPWWHSAIQALALLYAGRFQDAGKLISDNYRQALAEGSSEAQAVFASLYAESVGDRGRIRTSASRAREALAVNQQLGRLTLVRQNHSIGALALALGGHADEAADELEALDALGLPPVLRDEVDLLQARAWASAAGGNLPEARSHLVQAARLGEKIGDRVGEAASLHGLARMSRPHDVCERLTEVAGQMDGELAPARAAHANALVNEDAIALGKVSYKFEEMGADLLAAEASADAAVVRRQSGKTREAAMAEHRAGILAERCEDPVTPALQAAEVRARLTPTERETAALAAAGRSNKEIAAQLHLSSRTIENRLQRVYEKLGISGRTELSSALTPDD